MTNEMKRLKVKANERADCENAVANRNEARMRLANEAW